MMRVKKKEILYSILLTSAIIACLPLPGCKKDEPVDYGLKKYDKALRDVQKAQGLGFRVPAGFLNKLREDSGREKLIVDSHVPEMGIMQ